MASSRNAAIGQSYAAELNQLAITYSGNFFDDKLCLDLGLRMPDFKRVTLNNYCTQMPAMLIANPMRQPSRPAI